MLNDIRRMILEKKDYQEAASIIFEDGMGNLDDQIVLGEENDKPVEKDEPTVPPEDSEGNEEPGTPSEDEENVPPAEPEEDQEPNPDPEPTPSDEDQTNPSPDGDETPMPVPAGEDELPTPVGKQTGEPIEDADDLLDVSIDLKSNTIRDVLPVPPSNAGEAIGGEDDDDLLGQRIDSGFGGEDQESNPEPQVDMEPATPPENNPPESEPPVESGENDEQLTEAITLGNDAPAADAGSDDTPPADAGDPPPDDNGGNPTEENPVTSAVKDKVDEITSDEGSGDTAMSKDDLLKKLGNITKSLEDAKKAVMNTLQ